MKAIYFSLFLFFGIVSFSPANDSPLISDVVKHTNQFRKSKGMPPLTDREDLNKIAQKHSEDMAKGRVAFGHGGFNKRFSEARRKVDDFISFAENVAYGPTTGKEVVTMWKNSAGHRSNLLGKFKYIGVGTATDRQGRIYYTQVFVN
ncbi:MAG: CAP domain-containing protein [Chitinophagaceae bacterium]|nr:CAP domain-containing protein [Chitinophagaceae bacterium]